MCIDYSMLNLITLNDAWPLVYIDNLLAYLRGAKFFLKLHLCGRFHQISTHPFDYLKVDFACCYASFRFMVMLFGMKNALLHLQ